MPTDREVIDKYLQHGVRLIQAQNGEAEAVAKVVRALNNKAFAGTLRMLSDNMTMSEVRQLQLFLQDIYVDEWQKMVTDQLDKSGISMAIAEVEFQRDTLAVFAAVGVTAPTPQAVAVLSGETPFEGKLMKQWSADIGTDTLRRMHNELTEAFLKGEGAEKAARRIRDIDNINTRNARTVARTYIQHYASIARDSVITDNTDIVASVKWLSTLDHRTTNVCQLRDNLNYDSVTKEPLGHELPWDEGPGRIHFGCRSTSIPNITGVEFTGYRPAVEPGKNYEGGDDVTRTGRVRKPTKHSRDKGIFKVRGGENRGVVASTSYERWLRTQATQRGKAGRAFVEDILGKRKAAAFIDGTSLSSMSDPFGNPLTVKELVASGIL